MSSSSSRSVRRPLRIPAWATSWSRRRLKAPSPTRAAASAVARAVEFLAVSGRLDAIMAARAARPSIAVANSNCASLDAVPWEPRPSLLIVPEAVTPMPCSSASTLERAIEPAMATAAYHWLLLPSMRLTRPHGSRASTAARDSVAASFQPAVFATAMAAERAATASVATCGPDQGILSAASCVSRAQMSWP